MIDQFNIPNIKLLIEMGYEVHVGCNFKEGNTCSDEQIELLKTRLEQMNVRYYQIDFKRNIMKILDHWKAYKEVLRVMGENKYDFIHCHSPIGGVCGRLAGRATNTKVIYTAHGFHFYSGGSRMNWLLFYPIEKYLSVYTDTLVTINNEDYKRARGKFKANNTVYIPGVGVDFEKFKRREINKSLMRRELGISEEAFMILSVGELNKNKNHEVIIRAIARLKKKDIHYVICGKGILDKYLRELSNELEIEDQVHILGFRDDVPDLCNIADIFAFTSYREGLGLSALEAMACRLPIITSNIHGIVDYSTNELTGYNYKPNDIEGFSEAIVKLYEDDKLRKEFGENSFEVAKNFSLEIVLEDLLRLYGSYRLAD